MHETKSKKIYLKNAQRYYGIKIVFISEIIFILIMSIIFYIADQIPLAFDMILAACFVIPLALMKIARIVPVAVILSEEGVFFEYRWNPPKTKFKVVKGRFGEKIRSLPAEKFIKWTDIKDITCAGRKELFKRCRLTFFDDSWQSLNLLSYDIIMQIKNEWKARTIPKGGL